MSAESWRPWLLLAALAVLPFLRGAGYGFVYDDFGVIVENEYLADPANVLPTLALRTLSRPEVVDGGRPAVILSYFLDRSVWGLRPVGYHLHNLFLHAAVTLLVFGWARRLLPGVGPAFTCALLFAWHPLVVEPVQAPGFREDLLCLAGAMIMMLAGMNGRLSTRQFVASLAGLALALLSKESAVVLPVLMAAVWWLYPASRPSARAMTAWMAVTVVLTGAWASVVFFGRPVQSIGSEWNGLAFQGMERVWSFPAVALWYAVKLVIPFPLSVDYRFVPAEDPWEARVVAGLVLLVSGAWIAWRCRRDEPALAFGIVWVLAAFLPVSNLVPLFNPVADRYTYLMLPGFALVSLAASRRVGVHGWIAVLVVVIVYAFAATTRVGHWRSDEALWRHALQAEPLSARAHTWIGLIEQRAGRHEEAWALFTSAEELNPHDPVPTINKAVLVGQMGNLDEAETRLREVLKRYPGNRAARRNLAVSLRLQGREAEAAAVEAVPE